MTDAQPPLVGRPPQPRRRALLLVGLCFLAACVAAVLLTEGPRLPVDAEPSVRLPPAPAPSDAPLPPDDPRPASSLLDPAGAREMTFGEFAELLELEAARPAVAPAARAFVNAFKSQEVLERVRREFQEAEEQDKPRPAREFLDEVYRMPEFRRLAAQYGSASGSSALLALAKSPDIRRLGARWLSGLVSTSAPMTPAQAAARAAARGAEPGGKALMARLAPVFLSKAPPDRRDARTAAGQGGEGTGAAAGPAAGGAGLDAHKVPLKLATSKIEGEKEFDPLRSAFASLPKGVWKKVETRCKEVYDEDPGKDCELRQACADAGVWDDCARACAKSPPCEIGPKPGPSRPGVAAAGAVNQEGKAVCRSVSLPLNPATKRCDCCYDGATNALLPPGRARPGEADCDPDICLGKIDPATGKPK